MRNDNSKKAGRYADKYGLAEHIDVSPRTVEKWTRERTIPHHRISGRCVRYDLGEIDAWMAQRHVPVGGSDR